jgi:hypothetical protein
LDWRGRKLAVSYSNKYPDLKELFAINLRLLSDVVKHFPLYLRKGLGLTMLVIPEDFPKAKGLGNTKWMKNYSCRIVVDISAEIVKYPHGKR